MTDTALETTDLTRYYGGKLAVDHLTLHVPRGCIYALLGRNGAGKTTVVRMLLGLLKPTAGSARLLGCDCRALTPAIRQRIGYVSEGHRLLGWMRIAQLERFQRAFFPGRWDDGLFADMLEYFELSPRRKIKRLSNGQRAQVSLALAMAPNPELLIMDDPTLGLDTAIRRQFLEGMVQLIQRHGHTILFSSHILSDVERVADRIGVIDRGVLRADCTLETFRKSIRKVRLRFDGAAPPADVDIGGLLHARAGEGELELTLVGTSDEEIAAWAETTRATFHKSIAMNIEDQFIEFTATAARGRRMQWQEPSR